MLGLDDPPNLNVLQVVISRVWHWLQVILVILWEYL